MLLTLATRSLVTVEVTCHKSFCQAFQRSILLEAFIYIKEKLKNTLNKNVVFKKMNCSKTNTEYIYYVCKIVEFANIQLVSLSPNSLSFKGNGKYNKCFN